MSLGALGLLLTFCSLLLAGVVGLLAARRHERRLLAEEQRRLSERVREHEEKLAQAQAELRAALTDYQAAQHAAKMSRATFFREGSGAP